jgi:hypothetical protein
MCHSPSSSLYCTAPPQVLMLRGGTPAPPVDVDDDDVAAGAEDDDDPAVASLLRSALPRRRRPEARSAGSTRSVWHLSPVHAVSHTHWPVGCAQTPFKEQDMSDEQPARAAHASTTKHSALSKRASIGT